MSFEWRPHRGTLDDAMAEKRTFADFGEMVAFLNEDWGQYGVTVSDVTAKPYCFDERISWDTWIVTGAISNGEHPVLGFTNGNPNAASGMSLAERKADD